MHPWRAVRAPQQLVRLVVSHDPALLRVPRERPAELHGEVPQDAACAGDVALFDVGHRPVARADSLQEAALVGAVGGGGVPLETGLRLFVLVLIIIGDHVLMRWLTLGGDEIVLVHARLQRSLVPVEDARPRVLRE